MSVWMHLIPRRAVGCSGTYPAYLPVVGASSGSNLWIATGDVGPPAGVRALAWNGSAWTAHLYPAPGYDQIVGIRVFAADDVYLAGQHGIYHWDGAAWATELTAAAGETFTTLLYNTGTLYVPVNRYPLYLDYAKNYTAVPGGAWTSFTFSADWPGFAYGPIGAVMGSLTDAYVAIRGIGAPLYSLINRFDYSAVRRYLHWRVFDNNGDGFRMLYASGPIYALAFNRYLFHLYANNATSPNDWTVQSLPGLAAHDLYSGGGIGDSNVWVGGRVAGTADPDILAWDGATWTQTVPAGWAATGGPGWETALVSGLQVFSASDVWATGMYTCPGALGARWLFGLHWDGATWTRVL